MQSTCQVKSKSGKRTSHHVQNVIDLLLETDEIYVKWRKGKRPLLVAGGRYHLTLRSAKAAAINESFPYADDGEISKPVVEETKDVKK